MSKIKELQSEQDLELVKKWEQELSEINSIPVKELVNYSIQRAKEHLRDMLSTEKLLTTIEEIADNPTNQRGE